MPEDAAEFVQRWLLEVATIERLITTAILILTVITLHALAVRQVRRATRLSPERRRRWLVQLRNAMLLLLLLGLVVLWGAQLRAVALSAVAIAVALVIATKELIMCISGAVLEGSAQAFRLGDRIEIAGHRGDVYDQTLLTTTILEIGPGQTTHQHTGRTIVLPNSLLLTAPLINESATADFVLHSIVIPVRRESAWEDTERRLLDAAEEVTRPFLAEARRHMERVGAARGLKAFSVEPRITLQVADPDRLNLVLRFPVPARERGRVEQAILRRALAPGAPAGGA